MADDRAPEGWQVPQRKPMLIAATVPLTLIALLAMAGWVYEHRLAPARHAPVTTFPAPGIETFTHDGVGDPHRPRTPPKPDAAVEQAKRAQVAQGWR